MERNQVTGVLSGVILAFAVAGCASTPNSRGTGEFIDDAALTARVKTAIAHDHGLGEAMAINVDTYRGVVSLAGFVDNPDEARQASEVAARVKGVRQVKNNLEIKPAS
jgi:hyperosmotically inducible protein